MTTAPAVRAMAGRGARRARSGRPGRARSRHYLYLVPGFVLYAVFTLTPLAQTIQYSFYDWDGITEATWAGFDNYVAVVTDPVSRSTFGHSIMFIFFYTVLPTVIGLLIVAVMNRVRIRFLTVFRTVLFLPQILATVVIAVAWRWIFAQDGPINATLELLGLGALSRAWLGDFTTALPAVGLIGTWIMYGLCMVLFIGGVQKIPVELYEAARIDGAGPIREFFSVTLPGLRGEISIALVLTVTNALRNFDIVWNTTSGGPGTSTLVPSYLIYEGAFVTREVGFAAAASVVLTALILVITGAITRLLRVGADR
ncbi:sugar ABC transporter permease [Labedella phragmitis]|uniref:Sugar ABC transporter permease n=1 Tax=Labedella phragmitis TaxID=2498849 RepID=A0A3S3YW05_9MICO|nr:sugar ABC transporter permease [Labedella phragmitis]RWZ46304.1 sugar ABC transporter permease [Labedella phragmitis]